jgi:GT2 family glycosyltransferase
MTRCSVVVPAFNHAALTDQCLDAIFASRPKTVSLDVIVVDDGSTDSTADVIEARGDFVRGIHHERSTGFATACNDGAAAADGDWLVFLNNDTIPQPGWLDALVKYAAANERAGLVGAKLLYPDDTIQHAGIVISQTLAPRHVYSGFPAGHPAVNKSREFQVVTAACALVRTETFRRFGGFDPAFLNGYEDIDLCLRLRRSGLGIHYCHDSVLYHLESATRDPHSSPNNFALFLDRWRDVVYPDDLAYYAEDGLLQVTYAEQFPILLNVSPWLAVLDRTRVTAAERVLAERSRQVYEARKENARLRMELLETQAQQSSALRSNLARG